MGKIKVLAGDIEQGAWNTIFLFGKAQMYRVHTSTGKPTLFIDLKTVKGAEVQTEEKLKKLAGSAGWGFTGAVVGGLLTGGVGLVVGGLAGALSGGNKTEVCFSCELQDGRKFLAITDNQTWQKILAIIFSATQSDLKELDSAVNSSEQPPPSLKEIIYGRDSGSSTSSSVLGPKTTQPPKKGWMDLTQQQRDKQFMIGLSSAGIFLLLWFVGMIVQMFSSSPAYVTSPSSASSNTSQPLTESDATYPREQISPQLDKPTSDVYECAAETGMGEIVSQRDLVNLDECLKHKGYPMDSYR